MTENQIALVSMPAAGAHYPSMQLATLQSYVAEHGCTADTFELNLHFFKKVGPRIYQAIAGSRYLADMIFAPYVLGQIEDAILLKGKQIFRTNDEIELTEEEISLLTTDAGNFLDAAINILPWTKYPLVGFTLTHCQTYSSLALAKRLKVKFPGLGIVLGGIHCFGKLGEELMNNFEYIDYVVDGEGETVLLELLRRNGDAEGLDGCHWRNKEGVNLAKKRGKGVEMNDLPIPNFNNYFQTLKNLDLVVPDIRLPVESARGCWWNRCTFCSINIQYDKYRQKNAQKIADEIDNQVARYQTLSIHFTDSVQLKTGIKEMCQRIIDSGRDLSLTMEIYSAITREDLEVLRRAGLRSCQVGVEALTNSGLKKMRKGVNLLHTVQVMKWCFELGISNWYNLIAAYPGETEAEIVEMVALIPKLVHLEPPSAISKFKMNYGSLAYKEQLEKARFGNHLCPSNKDIILPELFESGLPSQLPEYWQQVDRALVRWHKLWSRHKPLLYYRDGGSFLNIIDTRDPLSRKLFTLYESQRELYLFCDKYRTLGEICRHFKIDDVNEVTPLLNLMCDRALFLEEEGQYLSLAPNGRNLVQR